jgi:hypothetical protein
MIATERLAVMKEALRWFLGNARRSTNEKSAVENAWKLQCMEAVIGSLSSRIQGLGVEMVAQQPVSNALDCENDMLMPKQTWGLRSTHPGRDLFSIGSMAAVCGAVDPGLLGLTKDRVAGRESEKASSPARPPHRSSLGLARSVPRVRRRCSVFDGRGCQTFDPSLAGCRLFQRWTRKQRLFGIEKGGRISNRSRIAGSRVLGSGGVGQGWWSGSAR